MLCSNREQEHVLWTFHNVKCNYLFPCPVISEYPSALSIRESICTFSGRCTLNHCAIWSPLSSQAAVTSRPPLIHKVILGVSGSRIRVQTLVISVNLPPHWMSRCKPFILPVIGCQCEQIGICLFRVHKANWAEIFWVKAPQTRSDKALGKSEIKSVIRQEKPAREKRFWKWTLPRT